MYIDVSSRVGPFSYPYPPPTPDPGDCVEVLGPVLRVCSVTGGAWDFLGCRRDGSPSGERPQSGPSTGSRTRGPYPTRRVALHSD